MIPSQMLKGTLEGCILKVIGTEETYGYGISEGTIYPMLLRLEKNHKIAAVLRESSTGPKRKYFYLTEEGKEEVKEFENSWKELEQAVNCVIGGKAYEQQN